MSLIFQPRKTQESHASPWLPNQKISLWSDDNQPHPNTAEGVLATHVELCHATLKVIMAAARILSSKFTPDTWISILKVALGVADCLLSEPIGRLTSTSSTSKGEKGGLRAGLVGMANNIGVAVGADKDKDKDKLEFGDDTGPRMGDELCEHVLQVRYAQERYELIH
jgi:hypothetical protein